MKFLLDENIDVRLADRLSSLGHDVTAVARDYAHSLDDPEILAIAVDEQRIIVTKDRDFSDHIFRDHLAHAGVLYLRMRGSFAAQRDRLVVVITDYADQLTGFLTVTDSSVRIGLPPADPGQSR